ncbi:hypothetical protein HPB49_016961 [Dermacentor silvarum]|uniref:Uncharacterized protein n=1 Tax=Dermacentor silvarum TaxID=543639 RepID=A0ACB8D752_DERSI|nr:hypothetical protein HPB49_016961 [Dermacentor silvarum]
MDARPYAANKASMREVSVLFDTAESTQLVIINRVFDFICSIAPEVIYFSSNKEAVAREFEKLSVFQALLTIPDRKNVKHCTAERSLPLLIPLCREVCLFGFDERAAYVNDLRALSVLRPEAKSAPRGAAPLLAYTSPTGVISPPVRRRCAIRWVAHPPYTGSTFAWFVVPSRLSAVRFRGDIRDGGGDVMRVPPESTGRKPARTCRVPHAGRRLKFRQLVFKLR